MWLHAGVKISPDIVRERAVIDARDLHWSERLTAGVVLRKGCIPMTDEIRRRCRGLVAGCKFPEEVSLAEAAPISLTGKILKRVLLDVLWQGRKRTVV